MDGLTWLASNVIGLPGAKGTNTSNSIYVNGNQHGNNIHHEFGRTHHFWPSLDALYNDLKSAPVRISVMGKFHNYKEGDFIKYNDGKLGEAVMLDVLEGTTGKKFTPMQNLSGHGPDGVYIDKSTNPATIFLAEAKSSINGADAAKAPTGSATARLDKWIADYEAGKYANAGSEALDTFQELKTLRQDLTAPVKGIWIQVEVPKLDSSGVQQLNAIVNVW